MSGAPILFLVVGKPTEDGEKLLILERLSQELKTWNEHLSGCKLAVELQSLIGAGTRVGHGQKELVLKNEKLTFVFLYNPTISSLRLFSKQYLAVKSCYRQLIYCGPALADCGSWLLRDGLLQFGDFARILKEVEMPDFEPFCINAFAAGKWSQDNLEKSTSLCIKLNPEKQQESSGDVDSGLSDVVLSFFDGEVSPDGSHAGLDAKEKFAVDCLGLQNRNSSIVRIGDFRMVINADATKFPTSLLDNSDLLLLTTSDIRSLKWLETCMTSSIEGSFHIGMLYSNALSLLPQHHSKAVPNDGSSSCCSTGEKEKNLMVNVGETLKSLIGHLSEANIPIQDCFSSNNPKPVTVYHKAGFGTLQLYPVAPSADSKEVKDFQKNPNNEGSLPGFPSTCCILVWLPFNKKVRPTRLFFGGLASQFSIIEGLSKLKNLQIFSAWEEQASAVEGLNKLNKLKSIKTAVQDKPVPTLTNGGNQKGKTSSRVKPSEASNVANQSGQRTTKPVDKNQTLPLMSKIERPEKKSANTTILSVPSKHEPAKPLASKPLKAPAAAAAPKAPAAAAASKAPVAAVAPKAAAKLPAKEPAASTGSSKPSTDAPTKQVSQSKPLLSKPPKDTKPPVKVAPPVNKAKPSKPAGVLQKKEVGDKAKLEASPRLEKKAKSQKASEKKDSEKKEARPVPRPAAAKAVIDQAPLKDVLKEEVIKPLVIESLGAKPESLTSESQREILDIVSPATESSDREKEDAETADELAPSDRKSEASELLSPSDAIESSQEKMDLPTPPKESADLSMMHEDMHASEERNVQEFGGDVEVEDDIVCGDVEMEEDILCGRDDLHGDSAVLHNGQHDVDQDSLANESEKELNKSDIATPEEPDIDIDEINCQEEVAQDQQVVTEPAKQIIDEMVKSGISLTESAGTESAPNENLYSVEQDFGDELPVSEEEDEEMVIQMERTLKEDIASGEKDREADFCDDVLIGSHPRAPESDECIEKDVLEEPEKLKEAQKQSAEELESVSKTDTLERGETEDSERPTALEGSSGTAADKEIICHKEDIFQRDEQLSVTSVAADEVEDQMELGRDDGDGQVIVESKLIEGIVAFEGCKPDALSFPQRDDDDVSEPLTDVVTEPTVEKAVVASKVEAELHEPFECRDEELMDISESSNGLDVVKEQLLPGPDMTEPSVTEEGEKEEVNKEENIGTGGDDLSAKLPDQVHLETSSAFDQTFNEECSVEKQEHQHSEEEKVESLINFSVSTDDAPLLLQSSLKKDSGISNLAALCNPFSSSGGDENDSTKALAGSISDSIPETKRSCDSDDLREVKDLMSEKEECPKEEEEFGQFCGEVADQLSKLKEHRDAVQELMTSSDDSNTVFYNKNVTFPRKERPDELSEEDQDELDTISEQPEIEEEEERLMCRADQALPFSVTEGVDLGQLIDIGNQPVILPDVLDIQAVSDDGSGHAVEESSCVQTHEQKDGPKNLSGDFIDLSFPEAAIVPGHGKDSNHAIEQQQLQDLSPDDISASVHSSSATADLIAAWGEPMKLPSPDKPRVAGSKKEVEASASLVPVVSEQVAKKKGAVKQSNGAGDSAAVKTTEVKKISKIDASSSTKKSDIIHRPPTTTPVVRPFYTDVAFVYDREDEHVGASGSYGVDFFRRMRSRYYLFSTSNVGVLDHLVEAKQSWDNTEVVTIAVASNMDWTKVESWVSAKEDLLRKLHITVLPSIDQNVFDSELHLRTF